MSKVQSKRGDKFNAIKAAQAANPDATAKEIVVKVKEATGLDVSAASVAAVRAKLKTPGKKVKGKRGRPKGSKNKAHKSYAKPVTGTDNLAAVRKLVDQFGSIEDLQSAIDNYVAVAKIVA